MSIKNFSQKKYENIPLDKKVLGQIKLKCFKRAYSKNDQMVVACSS